MADVPLVRRDIVTSKGDLFVFDGTDLVALTVGTDGHVLTAASGEAEGVEWAEPAPQTTIPVSVETASYTLVLGDAGSTVEMDVASANDLTVPPNSSVAFPVGTVIEVSQVGAGQTTVVAGSGVTIRTPETLVLTGQWSTVSLRKRATDEWVLAGDVEASA